MYKLNHVFVSQNNTNLNKTLRINDGSITSFVNAVYTYLCTIFLAYLHSIYRACIYRIVDTYLLAYIYTFIKPYNLSTRIIKIYTY